MDHLSEIRTYINDIRIHNQKEQEKVLQAKLEWEKKHLSETNTYTISYIKKGSKPQYQEFQVEGISNAIMIYNEYRKIGHSMNLTKVYLEHGEERIKKTNFKY